MRKWSPRPLGTPALLITALLISATCSTNTIARAGTPASADPAELKNVKFSVAYLKAPRDGEALVEVRIVDKHQLLRPHQTRAYIDNDGYYVDKTGSDRQLTLREAAAPGGGKEYVVTLKPQRMVQAGRHLLTIWIATKRGSIRKAFREFTARGNSLEIRKKILSLYAARLEADLAQTKHLDASAGKPPSRALKTAGTALRRKANAAGDAYRRFTRQPEVKRWLTSWRMSDPRAVSDFYSKGRGRSVRGAVPRTELDDGRTSMAEHQAVTSALKAKTSALLLGDYRPAGERFLLHLRVEGPGLIDSYHTLESPTVPRNVVLKGTVTDDRGRPASGTRVVCERMEGNSSATTAKDGSFTIVCTRIRERSWPGSFAKTDVKIVAPRYNPVARLLSDLDSIPIGDTSLTATDDRELGATLKLRLLGPEYYGSWGRNQKQLAPVMKAAREEAQKAYDTNAHGRAFYSTLGHRLRRFGDLAKTDGYTRTQSRESVDKFIAECGRTGGTPIRARLEGLRNDAVALMKRLDETWKKRFRLENTLRGSSGRDKGALKVIQEIGGLERRGREIQRQLAPAIARWQHALSFASRANMDALRTFPDAPPPLELRFSLKSKSGASLEATRYFYCEPKTLAIAGRVTDAIGKPMAGVTVKVTDRNATVLTGPDGGYKLLVKGKGKLALRRKEVNFRLAAFQLLISAGKPGYKSVSFGLPCKQMPGSIDISGKVLGADGKPLPNATVSLMRPALSARAISAEDGNFRLRVAKLASGGRPLVRSDVALKLAWSGEEYVIDLDMQHKPWVVGGRKLDKWAFLQAEAIEFSVRILHRGKPLKKPKITIDFMSPRTGSGYAQYQQTNKDHVWSEDGTALIWKGAFPAHASPGLWAIGLEAKVVTPEGKKLIVKDTKTFTVREDHRMTAAKLKENWQWVQREWQKRCEIGVVRRMYPHGLATNYDYHGVNLARNLARFVLPGYPKGRMGPVNNLLALYHNPPVAQHVGKWITGSGGDQSFFRYTCGGYAARALNILNGWRHSEDYETRRRLLGIEYTPVYHWPQTVYRNAWLNHIAVLVYRTGYKDLRRPTVLKHAGSPISGHSIRPDDSALVLEPWLDQKPLIMSASQWRKTFTDGTGMGLPVRGDGWENFTRVPGMAGSDYTHMQILADRQGDKDAGDAMIGALANLPRTRILSLSPVNVLVTDVKGRRSGVTVDSKVVGEIPGSSVEYWPDGKDLSQHILLPVGKYKVSISGRGHGKFGLAVIDPRRDPLFYAKRNEIKKGKKATLDLTSDAKRPALLLPGGKKVTPEVVPLRKVALELKAKLDQFGAGKSRPASPARILAEFDSGLPTSKALDALHVPVKSMPPAEKYYAWSGEVKSKKELHIKAWENMLIRRSTALYSHRNTRKTSIEINRVGVGVEFEALAEPERRLKLWRQGLEGNPKYERAKVAKGDVTEYHYYVRELKQGPNTTVLFTRGKLFVKIAVYSPNKSLLHRTAAREMADLVHARVKELLSANKPGPIAGTDPGTKPEPRTEPKPKPDPRPKPAPDPKPLPKPQPTPGTVKAPKGTSWLSFEEKGFWLAGPKGWKHGKPEGDLAAQLFEGKKNAFIEVYADKVARASLEKLFDAWEVGIRKRLPTVFVKRSEKSDRTLGCGTPAQFRKYNGTTGGAKVTARVVFTTKDGRACVAVGIYVDRHSKSFKSLVMRSVTSLRLKKP